MRPEHRPASSSWTNQRGYAGGPTISLGPPVLLRTPWPKGVLRRDPAVQQFPDLYADQSGRCRVIRVKGRMVTPAQVPQLRVTVEDCLYEGPVARPVPSGLAREGRPIPARFLSGLDFKLQLALVSGHGGGKLRRVVPQ